MAHASAALSFSELIEGFTKTTQGDDTTRIEYLESLDERLCSPVPASDVKILEHLKRSLLEGELQAANSDNASELHAARWKLLTKIVRACGVKISFIDHELQALLSLMLTERFEANNVLTAMAQWLVEMRNNHILTIANLLEMKFSQQDERSSLLHLIKQMYVTLRRPRLRQELAEVLENLVTSKDTAKEIIASGMLRCLLLVALEQPDEKELLQSFNFVGTRVASFVCVEFKSAIDKMKCDVMLVDERNRFACELVVALGLSKMSLVFADAVRMLQLLADNTAYRSLLPAVQDLRGFLEKAQTLARVGSHIVNQDEYLKKLCQTQYILLSPEIDTYERVHGSVVGLPLNDDIGYDGKGAEEALMLASNYKSQGNVLFRRGNYPTARAFYQRAVAVLKAAQLHEESLLRALSSDQLLKRCSIGTSVQVCSRVGGDWQNAMVSDIDEGASSQVEVIYDAGNREDEWIPISRIRLRMNTMLLSSFDDLAVDCFMNMGKSSSALGDHNPAIQCYTHALNLRGGKFVAALYFRGVAYMAQRELTASQQDLWNANQQCRLQQKSSKGGGTSETNTKDAIQMRALNKRISDAYKKLQELHAKKKKLDKKVVKQMLRYLSSVPELQDQSYSSN
ncbi:Tetratricopeptide TPR1 [Plasmopara halstedii]|uniref:Tetratricopeptide TPR1 n=1 Tax=Plasmopara halstedii TaxID=4781 RepID=A0A0P1ALN3_PLAHL|nr:Tetratricopeptide TPR1 [Plasmopara halstedii]CEG42017.1 Tetratricopeptide TPR1 [Plasmopara halstedii]|eukprot:XP_024578386.1 Tetratricopeptide TPR1 [Plasmopara halstedii]